MRGHHAPTVDLQVPGADLLREVSEEEPDVMPVLEERPARDRAIHDVVPRARVVHSGSSCHVGRLPPMTDERGRCGLRRWCGSAVGGCLAPYTVPRPGDLEGRGAFPKEIAATRRPQGPSWTARCPVSSKATTPNSKTSPPSPLTRQRTARESVSAKTDLLLPAKPAQGN